MNFLKTLKGEILDQLSVFESAATTGDAVRNNCKIYYRARPTNKRNDSDITIQFSKRFMPNIGLQKVLESFANSESPLLLIVEEWKILTQHQISAKLRRSQVFAVVLEDVCNSGSRFGYPAFEKKMVVWNNLTTDTQDLSMHRTCYAQKHMINLLTACGVKVVCSRLEDCQLSKDAEALRLDFINKVKKCHYVSKKEENDVVAGASCEPTCGVFIRLKQYLNANDLSCDKLEFDNSIDLVPVLYDDQSWSLQVKEIFELESMSKVNGVPDSCVILTPLNLVFITQQIILTWRAIGQYCPCEQKYCAVAPVLPLKNSSTLLSIAELKTAIMADLETASAHKYGSVVNSENWKQMLEPIAEACIKYNLLSTSLQQPVKLEIDKQGSLRNIKSGSFILYNYARLSSLLDQFNTCVQEEKYPALPSIHTVDWCLLRKEEEWGLLLRYIAQFPELIDETVSGVLNDYHTQVKFPIHKLYLFLLNLSHDVSTYYSAVHVLGNPIPHLFPQMFARLHLLRAVHQIMTTIFSVLDIIPLRQM